MKRLAILFPASLAVCGAYVMWTSLGQMTYYNHERGAPGPGFLPFWLSVGLVVLGSILAIRALRAETTAETVPRLDPVARRRLLLVFTALVVTIAAFEPLGFVLTAALFMLVVGFGLGLRSWTVLVPAALGVAVGIHALFSWLGVVLPAGIFGP